MPHYYFHVVNGSARADPVGIELPDLDAAKREASRYAGEMLRDNPDAIWKNTGWMMVVSNVQGMTLFVLHFLATAAPFIRM